VDKAKLAKSIAGVVAALAVLIWALAGWLWPDAVGEVESWLSSNQPGQYFVASVADGDTITVSNGGDSFVVRLIGVDTPETHHPNKPVQCYGEQAGDYLDALLAGEVVRLEADPASDETDRYDRKLRYVYRSQDDLFINQHLVERGYGVSYRSFAHSKLPAFEYAETEARRSGLGLWSNCQPKLNDYGVYETEPAR
jgi:endonuclease YncB( thermonuclease family)